MRKINSSVIRKDIRHISWVSELKWGIGNLDEDDNLEFLLRIQIVLQFYRDCFAEIMCMHLFQLIKVRKLIFSLSIYCIFCLRGSNWSVHIKIYRRLRQRLYRFLDSDLFSPCKINDLSVFLLVMILNFDPMYL